MAGEPATPAIGSFASGRAQAAPVVDRAPGTAGNRTPALVDAVLLALGAAPASGCQLARRLGRRKKAVLAALRELQRAGLIEIEGGEKAAKFRTFRRT